MGPCQGVWQGGHGDLLDREGQDWIQMLASLLISPETIRGQEKVSLSRQAAVQCSQVRQSMLWPGGLFWKLQDAHYCDPRTPHNSPGGGGLGQDNSEQERQVRCNTEGGTPS